MKKIKSIKPNIESDFSVYHEHSIYELSNKDMKKAGLSKKYYVDLTLSEYALDEMDLTEILQKANQKANYVYDVVFADTVEEAELKYMNVVLQCRIVDLQRELKFFAEKLEDLKELFAQEISFSFNKD